MATARLRRTFRHVDDEYNDDEPEVLDEQEQDGLIQLLAEQNRRRNEQFRQLLVAVPVLATVPFLLACGAPATTATASSSAAMLALLGLTSLAATAYLLHRQPTTVTGIALLDAWSGAVPGAPTSSRHTQPLQTAAQSPLDRHLPLLNAGLCTVLLLSLLLPRPAGHSADPGSGGGSSLSHRVLASLPALVYGVVLVGKVTMAGVDPERDLGRLRYDYKGA